MYTIYIPDYAEIITTNVTRPSYCVRDFGLLLSGGKPFHIRRLLLFGRSLLDIYVWDWQEQEHTAQELVLISLCAIMRFKWRRTVEQR